MPKLNLTNRPSSILECQHRIFLQMHYCKYKYIAETVFPSCLLINLAFSFLLLVKNYPFNELESVVGRKKKDNFRASQ